MITKFNFKDKTIKSYAIRKLTPKECYRLMGVRDAVIHIMQSTWQTAKETMSKWFPKHDFLTGKKGANGDMVISASQQYKQAGNSIVVDTLVALMEPMFYPPEKKIDTRAKELDLPDNVKIEKDGQITFF